MEEWAMFRTQMAMRSEAQSKENGSRDPLPALSLLQLFAKVYQTDNFN